MGCLSSAAAARLAGLFPGSREEYAASGQPDGHLRGSELALSDYSVSEAKNSLPQLIAKGRRDFVRHERLPPLAPLSPSTSTPLAVGSAKRPTGEVSKVR